MKIKKTQWYWHVLLILCVIILLFPILFACSNSFKALSDAYQNVFEVIPSKPTLENYRKVFENLPFVKITVNTFLIAVVVTACKTLTSILAAYAFVYLPVKGKDPLYFVMLSTMFIPFTVTMIPNYLMISRMGMSDSLLGVMLPQFADVLGIFMLRQAMRGIPKSLIEVMQLEKAGNIRIMSDVVVPLIRPSVMSIGIIFFINSWNEYVWPVLILKTKDHYTLSLALQMYVSAEGGTDFTVAMAVSVLTMAVPLLLYFIFQRFIINTFAMSGIKG